MSIGPRSRFTLFLIPLHAARASGRLLAGVQVVAVLKAIVKHPAVDTSGQDEGQHVPEEDFVGHGCKPPRTRLAAKCSARAIRSQPTALIRLNQGDMAGGSENAWPRTPTATQAVEARSKAFASSLVFSL